jgi:hypothetical protein
MLSTSAFSLASVLFIPKTKVRQALVSFLSFQTLTWAGHLFLTENGTIEFPIRLFARATKGGILFNFLLFPMIFVWFILLLPGMTSLFKKIYHYAFFISIIVCFIKFTSDYTNLQNFLKGTPASRIIRLYINFIIYFVVCHIFVLWFSKRANLSKVDKKNIHADK